MESNTNNSSTISDKSQQVLTVLTQESQEATYGYPGGIPTSMVDSGQQWDFPNAWPPTTEIVVTALRNAREEYPVRNVGSSMP